MYICTPAGQTLPVQRTDVLHVLGAALDGRGSSWRSVNYRLLKGEACFWVQSVALCGASGVQAKLRAWTAGPATCAIHDSSSWHVAQDLLTAVKRWEFKWLRKILRLKRAPDENLYEYNCRTSRRIIQWSQATKSKLMHHRVLLSIFHAAWREAHHKIPRFADALECCEAIQKQALVGEPQT